jgi:hypothetical protein
MWSTRPPPIRGFHAPCEDRLWKLRASVGCGLICDSGTKATDPYLVGRPPSTREAELAIRGSSQVPTADYVEVWTVAKLLGYNAKSCRVLSLLLSDRGHNCSVFQRVRTQPVSLLLTLELLWLNILLLQV